MSPATIDMHRGVIWTILAVFASHRRDPDHAAGHLTGK